MAANIKKTPVIKKKPSKTTSRERFNRNLEDEIVSLLTLAKEKPEHESRLIKSTVVLVCAYWEAFCEDLVSEALEFVITNCKSADELPNSIKKVIADKIKKDPNQLSPWKLADDCWKDYLKASLKELTDGRNNSFNTPKPDQVDDLFKKALGIENVSDSWTWKKGTFFDDDTTSEVAKKQLKDFVTLRGQIAHRGESTLTTRTDVILYFRYVIRIMNKTEDAVNSYLKSEYAKGLY